VNARDAMPGGGRLVIESTVEQIDEATPAGAPHARVGCFVCLSVTDTGCGIPSEMLPQIFEPFFTTKEVGKGTGLGLATVHGIVQQHGGWINVQSEIGKGTTFRIYLPCLSVPAASATARPAPAASSGGTETILLVEDEPVLRTFGRRFLTKMGYRVLEAADGHAALEVWRQHPGEIQLLLTDLVMPGGMTGLQLAQLLMEEVPGLKVIYTSGYSAEIAGKDLALQEGVNFLGKPFEPARLAQAVRTLLDG